MIGAIREPQTNPFHTHGEKPPGVDGEFMPRFEFATPYGPYPDESGLDRTFALGALHALRDGWEEMRAQRPHHYVGLAVDGSMIKGRAHANSDIDAVLYVDPDPPVPVYAKFRTFQAVRMDYQRAVSSRLLKAGYSQTVAMADGNIVVASMNESRIDGFLRVCESANRTRPLQVEHAFVALFGMRVGTGKIPLYRQRLMDGLSSMDDGQSTRCWTTLMNKLLMSEEYPKNRNASIYLPWSLDEAYDYFRLPKPDPKPPVPPPDTYRRRIISYFVKH